MWIWMFGGPAAHANCPLPQQQAPCVRDKGLEMAGHKMRLVRVVQDVVVPSDIAGRKKALQLHRS